VLAPLRSTGGYAKQKFPGLELREIETLVEQYRTLTGRFAKVKVQPVHAQTFTIEAH
jgi:hypothetical protein